MSLIVEDGTGLSTAQSYASVAEADAYHLALGNTSWGTATTANKETALTRASRALDGMYGARWPGLRVQPSQALDWPRFDAEDREGYEVASDSVPQAVKNACCEAALVELGEAYALSKSLDRGGRVKREKLGALETEYADGAPAGKSYPAIYQALARLIPSAGLTIRRA